MKIRNGSALLCEAIKSEHDHLNTSAIKGYSPRCSVSIVSAQSPTVWRTFFWAMSVKSFVSKLSNWCSVTMLSGKTVKLVLYEVLQFAALVVPVFVIMQRFASLVNNLKRGNETVYWLVVAASIAYVTSATLLVWVPVKYIILKRQRFSSDTPQWWVLLGGRSFISREFGIYLSIYLTLWRKSHF